MPVWQYEQQNANLTAFPRGVLAWHLLSLSLSLSTLRNITRFFSKVRFRRLSCRVVVSHTPVLFLRCPLKYENIHFAVRRRLAEELHSQTSPINKDFVPAKASMFVQPFVQPVVDSMKDGTANSVAQTAEDIALKKASDARLHRIRKYLWGLRRLVENAFLKLKRWLGIATMYAKNMSSFLAAVHVSCIALWEKSIDGTI